MLKISAAHVFFITTGAYLFHCVLFHSNLTLIILNYSYLVGIVIYISPKGTLHKSDFSGVPDIKFPNAFSSKNRPRYSALKFIYISKIFYQNENRSIFMNFFCVSLGVLLLQSM